VNKIPIRRQKRCHGCHDLFTPDPRTKGKQEYCSREACQKKRQRRNEKAWRKRNPDCVKEQQNQTRKWHKARPGYSRARRRRNPGLAERNRKQTQLRMRKLRDENRFDKSKLILRQLTKNKGDKCYLDSSCRWIYVRLTKASTLLNMGVLRDNRDKWRQVTRPLPRRKLYDLSADIFDYHASGP